MLFKVSTLIHESVPMHVCSLHFYTEVVRWCTGRVRVSSEQLRLCPEFESL